MGNLEELQDKHASDLDESVVLDDLDSAIIGVEENSMRIIYSVSKIIGVLQDQGMSLEEALVWYYFNIVRAIDYMGEKKPILCDDL